MRATPQSVIGGQFDYIVVGAGSAGCVMAARLTENPKARVLLIEAGMDFPPGQEPDQILAPRSRTFTAWQYFWNTNRVEGAIPGHFVPFAQGRLVGGGSTVNGMHAQRGEPSDYDEWRQLGVVGWNWDDVVPYFNKLETDLDFSGPLHGKNGPIKIKRVPPEKWSVLSKAYIAALQGEGVPFIQDVNVESGESIAALPFNALDKRVSASIAYLTPEVRARGNFALLANTSVRRVLFANRKASGVELDGGGKIHAANVILCGGAIQSPVLLQRSGIGAGADLRAAGIEVIADRKGVGSNLQNHPFMDITMHLTRKARARDPILPPGLIVGRLSSHHPGAPPADLILNLWERVPGPLPRDPLSRHFGDFMLILNKGYSEGSVAIDPKDPFGVVDVRTNILGDSRDRDRMIEGFKRVVALAKSKYFDGLVTDIFALKPHWAVIKLLQGDWQARVLSELGGIGLEAPGALRRFMLRNAVTPIDEIVKDPATLEKHVLANCLPGGHPGGTCRLGDPAQDTTVVDSRCRVVGVDGLRVADAAIFPTLMRAGTNLPTMMAAEKAAVMIQEDARGA